MDAPQPYYVSSVPPPLPPLKYPGRFEGVVGLFAAFVSLFLFPPIFGISGIIFGIRAKHKGARKLGNLVIAASLICMIGGMIFGALLSGTFQEGAFMGIALPSLR